MANRKNMGNYDPPMGVTKQEQDSILHKILDMLERRKPIGGWESRDPNSDDLAAVQEVVNYLNSKGLTEAKTQSPQELQKPRSRGSRHRR